MRSFLNWIKRILGMSTVKCKGSKTVTRARKGDTGNGGITYRISLWEDGKEYRNDSALETDGVRIIDVACNMGMAMIGDSSFVARKCKITHQADHQLIPLENNTYWEDVNQFQPIVTPVLLAQAISADYIDVNSLVAKHVQVKSGNNVIADMGGNANYPLMLGGTTTSAAKSYFDAAGNLFCNGGIFKGRLAFPFVTITNYHQLVSTDGTSFILQGVMGNGELNLPADSAFNGWLINVFSWPRLSKMDGYGVVSGHILCPEKATISGNLASLYFASSIQMDEAGGFMQFVCVNSQWVLINKQVHGIVYTQSSNPTPDW